MTGATSAPTGTPALASVSIAASRRFGLLVRDSSLAVSEASSVVTEMKTTAA